MRKKYSVILCAAALSAALLSGCSGGKIYTEEEYAANYDTGYQAGYDDGVKEGVQEDRARQVQTMNYETFAALNEKSPFTGVIYVGRAACPYCGAVTDYMRGVTDLAVPVYYVSLEPYYNSPYYDDFKAELGIEAVPTFIYYKDGKPNFYMDSPVIPGYFDLSGQDRVDGYNQMVERINAFVEGCAKDDPSAIEDLWEDAGAGLPEEAAKINAEAEAAAGRNATPHETTAAESGSGEDTAAGEAEANGGTQETETLTEAEAENGQTSETAAETEAESEQEAEKAESGVTEDNQND